MVVIKPKYKLLRRGGYVVGDTLKVEKGIDLLQQALRVFTEAGAPLTAARVRSALSSARDEED